MDPTLLHQSQPSQFDFADKYLGQGRPFPNPLFSANDLSFAGRRAQSTLTSGMSAVALPANPSLDFNGNSLLSETPYHQTSQLLLSPPDSTTGSASTSGNPTTSSNVYTTLPKPFPSNADHFVSAHPSILSSNWTGSSMTVMDRPHRVPTLSPPQASHSYNSATGIVPPFRPFDAHRVSTYSTIGPQISPSSFPPGLRYAPSSYPPRPSGHFPFSVAEPNFPGQSMPQDNQTSARGQGGPSFHETKVRHEILTLRGARIAPEITASIQKGFFQVEHKWTCYRRNYFSVQCAFSFRTNMAEQPFYINRHGTETLIQHFAVSLSAKTATPNNGESEPRGLVQHTPKRDKASESVPGRHSIAPAPSHALSTGATYASTGHTYASGSHLHSIGMGAYGGFENPGSSAPPTSHTFERIQFQKATANNGKRRAQQQYFSVVVELSANIGVSGHDDWVLIATKDSDPMVVRGRSPGHYKDNGRRDSHSSMDPDCGAGHGSTNHAGSLSSGNFSHGHGSMDWSSNFRGPNGHYAGNSYRLPVESRISPESMMSSSTLAETKADPDARFSDSSTTKSSCTLSSDRSRFTPLSDGSDDMMFSSLDHDHVGRKRKFEGPEEGEHLRFPLPEPFTDSASSLNEFTTAIPYAKLLCAS